MNTTNSISGSNQQAGMSDTRPKALVVDDEMANRKFLTTLLDWMGYRAIEAEDGAIGVERFKDSSPDIVFMDVMMPVMDGYEAAGRIKALCKETFIPIIFLTALTDDKDLARCVEAGGDDFLTKPINKVLLEAKIRAMERIRHLHLEISRLYSLRHQEDRLAEKIFSTAVVADNVALSHIDSVMKPAELFSGDVLLTAYTPSGDLHVMLGDFTGHGLAAAIGAMPVAEAFRSMTAKGFGCEAILNEIGDTLYRLLPTGMFMACQFLTVSRQLDMITVANCGMPEILVLDKSANQIKNRVPSASYPLGIVEKVEYHNIPLNIPVIPGDRVLLISDGVIDARNPAGELFAQHGLEEAIEKKPAELSLLRHLSEQIDAFCADVDYGDDLSMVDVPCVQDVLPSQTTKLHKRGVLTDERDQNSKVVPRDAIELTVSLQGPQLLQMDPVPIVINQIQQLTGLSAQRQTLFTILSELYTNAFEHGVLALDSSLKGSAEGFDQYYLEREARLNQLCDDFVRISLTGEIYQDGGRVVIWMEDSGAGFDYAGYMNDEKSVSALCGRGIRLVKALCESVRFEAPGNKVEVVYVWSGK